MEVKHLKTLNFELERTNAELIAENEQLKNCIRDSVVYIMDN